MIIYPAIDLRQGRCVRLMQGRRDREIVYGEDPVAVACLWASQGAEWLHVVNLDGAFQDLGRESNEALSPNLRALQTIAKATSLPIQFGGGLRRWEDIVRAFELGAKRAVLGTVAIEEPELLARALAHYGAERVAVSIDAQDGLVVTHGWEQASQVEAIELGRRVAELGVRLVVHTDVARDGTLAGANVAASLELAERTGLRVIVSGGITSVEEIRRMCRLGRDKLEGAIIGRALYTGDIHLPEAIAAGKETM